MTFLSWQKFILIFFQLSVIGLTNHCFATDLYISKTGSDRNPGTISKPLATFEGARDKVRNIHEPVTVHVRAGVYYLSKPVIFGQEDSRKPAEEVIYQSYKDEKVVISGAKELKLKWLIHKGNIRKASVSNEVIFDQLYINGQQLRMARYPNYNPASSHFGGYSADVLDPARIKSWKNPQGAFVHALHKHEWGGYHYKVTGKETDGKLKLEGGYQNNRQMGMHDKYRFVENVFEELDTAGEWYFNKQEKMLYLYPSDGQDLSKSRFHSPQLRHLFEFRGSAKTPVKNIGLRGFEFAHLMRTFMETREPLLRSDWAIYRGGTVIFDGTENCFVKSCYFNAVGGNAVFFNNYNRNSEVSGCHIENAGASGVCFVGDPSAARSPSFEYNQAVSYEEMDKQPGPKTSNYPAECKVYDNLMHGLGQVEKQVAGVEISMAMDITVSHNTIYNVPRSGINVSEGTWGGHLIEYNDVFNTVLETGDHGSFNSWGRDRYWHPQRDVMNKLAADHPETILLDAQKTVVIRNNRFRCDHGWDIDLDDGSSNYHIYNNVCLNGGLKLREGFQRTVENNVIINNSFHPHVWFKNSGDIFRKNIVLKSYYPIQVSDWGKEVDYNLFPDQKALNEARKNSTDSHSAAGDPLFKNTQKGNYQVLPGSPALKLGFVNFPMDEFGVVSPDLKAKAASVILPAINTLSGAETAKEITWLGGKLRNVNGLGDRSAFGLPDEKGVIIEYIAYGSILSKSDLKNGDVIRSMNNKTVANVADLTNVFQEINWTGKSEIEVFRNQQILKLTVSFK
ncbi:PDZ domain-containing protein [Dyadobacter psychrotolerans]|uniref:PDZ domain-containing protein n=1 Tax=Dyadobacter psychrotolerans TaxID=2541721 RepID=A0A4R5DHD1_9BACT|nr:PDZ domain-containing protein [Dyadobacter psychrotolerans]TDE11330.1 PDZ domain-containing protein [Dyadobacter psychrotolerans]